MKRLFSISAMMLIGILGLHLQAAPQSVSSTSIIPAAIAQERTPPSFFTNNEIYSNSQGRYSLTNIRDELLPSIARFVGGFIGAIAVLFLIGAGIQFLTAGGDPEKISKAAKTAFYIVAALILMSFAYALVYLFLTIFTPAVTPPNASAPSTTTTPSTDTPSGTATPSDTNTPAASDARDTNAPPGGNLPGTTLTPSNPPSGSGTSTNPSGGALPGFAPSDS